MSKKVMCCALLKAMTSAKVAKIFVAEGDKVDVKNILIELTI